jgi:2-polyprenyl-6-methoxyphenol hydroxylase-like FAD-dependent oxidoreductase
VRDADVIIVGAGPAGLMLASVTARYLVGCDGAHSRVRGTAGIPFPDTTYRGQPAGPGHLARFGDPAG